MISKNVNTLTTREKIISEAIINLAAVFTAMCGLYAYEIMTTSEKPSFEISDDDYTAKQCKKIHALNPYDTCEDFFYR